MEKNGSYKSMKLTMKDKKV